MDSAGKTAGRTAGRLWERCATVGEEDEDRAVEADVCGLLEPALLLVIASGTKGSRGGEGSRITLAAQRMTHDGDDDDHLSQAM